MNGLLWSAATKVTKTPLLFPLGEDMSIGVEDVQHLKYIGLAIVAGILWQFAVGVFKWWVKRHDKSEDELKKFMKEIREDFHLIKNKVNETHVVLLHIQSTKADIKHVHEIARQEIEYADKLRGQ